jgi:hypothetical protein
MEQLEHARWEPIEEKPAIRAEPELLSDRSLLDHPIGFPRQKVALFHSALDRANQVTTIWSQSGERSSSRLMANQFTLTTEHEQSDALVVA